MQSYDVPLIIADMHGEVRLQHGEGEDTDRPEIDRRDLRILLLNSVPEDKIQWGTQIESVQKQGDGRMSVHFADGSNESGFRLVVGADGAWSKARSLVSITFSHFWLPCFKIDVSTGYVYHAKICRQILSHQQYLTPKPIPRHCRRQSAKRQLHEHGRPPCRGRDETR